MSSKFALNYVTLRNLTPPGFDAVIYRGVCKAPNLMGIPTDKNVRDAMQKKTKLGREMRESIASDPRDFVLKNGGVTILARDIEVDDKGRVARIEAPSIINGAQTQACIEWWCENHGDDQPEPLVQFEILRLPDEELEREVSVTRNSTHQVNVTSIVGYQGGFDELVADVDDKFSLRETDPGEDPLKLLQVAELLDDTWDKPWSTYTSKASVLKRYCDATAKRRAFLHGIAPEAWKLYRHFQRHPGFQSCGLQAKAGGVSRDKNGRFVEASDAIVFPILYAHRERVARTKIDRLPRELEDKLIRNATQYFTTNAQSDVATMGRKPGAYSDLRGRLEWLKA